MTKLRDLVIGIKGAGEMASGIALRLHRANIYKIYMMEIPFPLAVRREVSFSEAVHEGRKRVEGVEAVRIDKTEDIPILWKDKKIPMLIDPQGQSLSIIKPHVSIDAILSKKNLGTVMNEAPLVIALGPGFVAGKDAHFVIETNRGHNLGKIISSGTSEPNTGQPVSIRGFSEERVLRAPAGGKFVALKAIGDPVKKNEAVASVHGTEIRSEINGVLRGLIRPNTEVTRGLKVGDIDPRSRVDYCYTISDKARAVSGSVLEAVLRVFNVNPNGQQL